MKITTIGVDTAKSIFHLVAAIQVGSVVKAIKTQTTPGVSCHPRTLPGRDGGLWRRQLLGEGNQGTGPKGQAHRTAVCEPVCQRQ